MGAYHIPPKPVLVTEQMENLVNVKFADRKRYYEIFDSYYRDNDAGAMVQMVAE